MTSNILLHVSVPGRRPQTIFQIRGIQALHTNLGMHRSSAV